MAFDYAEYISSEHWKQKRIQRLKLDGFICQICGTAKNLNVHHITYEHIPFEPLDDLITLCKSCHESVHATDLKKKRREPRSCRSVKRRSYETLSSSPRDPKPASSKIRDLLDEIKSIICSWEAENDG